MGAGAQSVAVGLEKASRRPAPHRFMEPRATGQFTRTCCRASSLTGTGRRLVTGDDRLRQFASARTKYPPSSVELRGAGIISEGGM